MLDDIRPLRDSSVGPLGVESKFQFTTAQDFIASEKTQIGSKITLAAEPVSTVSLIERPAAQEICTYKNQGKELSYRAEAQAVQINGEQRSC